MELLFDYLTGSISSATASFLVYPLDYLKMTKILK